MSLRSLVAFGQSGYDANFDKFESQRGGQVKHFRHKIIDDRHGKPTITVERHRRRDLGCLILFLLVILRQAFLEVLGAEGIQCRVIARPASRREMRAASQAFTATGSP